MLIGPAKDEVKLVRDQRSGDFIYVTVNGNLVAVTTIAAWSKALAQCVVHKAPEPPPARPAPEKELPSIRPHRGDDGPDAA
jgi:hypothetical protein